MNPPEASLSSGESLQFTAVAIFGDGTSDPTPVTFSATGGTISPGGLYTAGGTAGTFRVIATQLGGSLADTARVVLTTTSPVLQAVILTPANISLVTGATQPFSVAGQWSNGATTAPSVTYSATGGTISPGGLYTAGGTAGTFRVIATQQGGSLADTAAVTIATLGGLPPEAPGWVATAGQIIDHDFGTPAGQRPAGWYESGVSGAHWTDSAPSTTGRSWRTLESDPSAPRSAGTIARVFYPVGMLADVTGSPSSMATKPGYYRRVFTTVWFRISAGFEWQDYGGTKLMYIPATYLDTDANWVIVVRGAGTSYNLGIVNNDGLNNFGTPINIMPRAATVTVATGQWVRLSFEAIGSTGGAANGSFRSWVNGIAQGETTPVKFGPGTSGLTGVNLDGYWGGGGGKAKTKTDWIDWDHISSWGSN